MMKNTWVALEMYKKKKKGLLQSVKLNSSGKYLPDTGAAAQRENNITKVPKA